MAPPNDYHRCLLKLDERRKAKFDRLPRLLKRLAGEHTVVKVFAELPEDVAEAAAETLAGPAGESPGKIQGHFVSDPRLRAAPHGPLEMAVFEFKGVSHYFPVEFLAPGGRKLRGSFSGFVEFPEDMVTGGGRRKEELSLTLTEVGSDYVFLDWEREGKGEAPTRLTALVRLEDGRAELPYYDWDLDEAKCN